MENKGCSLVGGFLIVCSIMLGPNVNYIIRSHDQKSPVAPHCVHLEPRNTSVLLTTLSATHDARSSAHGVA